MGPQRPGIEVDLAELTALRARALGLAAGRPRSSREPTGGLRPSPFRGRGMEYAESRLYAAGDDVRHIDWRVTARSGRVHSKLFQPERERITAVVVDTAPSMAFGTRVCFKSVQAARLGALLLWLALAEGDRLCAACCGSRDALQPPLGGRRGALRALELLVAAGRLPYPPAAAPEALPRTLDRLGRLLRPGSHLLLLLDPRSVDEAACAAMRRLAAHHDLVAALLVDPLERAPPPPARYAVAGHGERRLLALDEAPARAAWQQHFEAQLQQATAALQRSGVAAQTVATDVDPLQALRSLLHGGRSRSAA